MLRQRLQVAAVLGALATSAVLAIGLERATFILTNGEKLSGNVVFHTEARTNIRADKNEFNVGVADGRELPIPFAQVALIDFVGGTPRNAELAALPTDGAHMLVRRNGDVRVGRLIDLVGGDTVRWEAKGGNREDLPIREVSRIYLDSDSARRIYDFRPNVGGAGGGGVGRRGRGMGQQQPEPVYNTTLLQTLTVRGSDPWTVTNLNVRQGEQYIFKTTGEIFVTRGDTGRTTANGVLGMQSPSYPSREARAGALIGRMGRTVFIIGENGSPIAMSDTGRLSLGINDDNFEDNSGSFRVEIYRVR